MLGTVLKLGIGIRYRTSNLISQKLRYPPVFNPKIFVLSYLTRDSGLFVVNDFFKFSYYYDFSFLSLKPSQEKICIVRPVQLFSKSSPFHSTSIYFDYRYLMCLHKRNGTCGLNSRPEHLITKDGIKIKSCTFNNSAMKNSMYEWTSLLYSNIVLYYSLCTQVRHTSSDTFLLFF